MNKKVLGIGAASFALAALPVVGVFATTVRTDTLSVTIEKGCSFTSGAAEGVNHSVTLGQGSKLDDIQGVKFSVLCNGENDGTWTLQAIGEDGAAMSDGLGNEIKSTSETLDGSTSNWAFRIEATGGAQIEDSYNKYAQIPSSLTSIAKNGGAEANADGTIQAYYGVSASAEQTPGTYTGRVTYTLTNVPKG